MSYTKINNVFSSLGISTIIYNFNVIINLPIRNKYMRDVRYLMSLKNMRLIIIEEMCLGIFLTAHAANKLPFIKSLLSTNLSTNLKYCNKLIDKSQEGGCIVLTIDSEWDINSWDYNKLCDLPRWINILDTEDINKDIYLCLIGGVPKEKIDYKFCQAMGREL